MEGRYNHLKIRPGSGLRQSNFIFFWNILSRWSQFSPLFWCQSEVRVTRQDAGVRGTACAWAISIKASALPGAAVPHRTGGSRAAPTRPAQHSAAVYLGAPGQLPPTPRPHTVQPRPRAAAPTPPGSQQTSPWPPEIICPCPSLCSVWQPSNIVKTSSVDIFVHLFIPLRHWKCPLTFGSCSYYQHYRTWSCCVKNQTLVCQATWKVCL